ncbi:hypothetical protein M3Y97_01133400 [Aphelenchoides bicaudatus]|nr:hypothetical protein M3Y97_01133400 [Aphelenchoides bicaudatus]
MQLRTLVCLALLGFVSVATAHFKSGSDFFKDEKDRYNKCKPLVEGGTSSTVAGIKTTTEAATATSPNCNTVPVTSEAPTFSTTIAPTTEATSEAPTFSTTIAPITTEAATATSPNCSTVPVTTVAPGNSTSSGEPTEYCFLLQIFLQFSVNLEYSLQVVFKQWINKVQVEIVQNSALTEYQIIVELYYSLQLLFVQYPQIEVEIQYLYIGEWGYVCDLEGLVIDIQTATTTISIQQVITISGVTCPLTEALNQCAQNASASDQAAIQLLIQNITATIQLGYSLEVTLSLIYESFSGFFVQYPSLVSIVYSGEISGFGILQSYIDICAVYWRIEHFWIAIGGPVSSCELIESLYALYTNQSYNISQRQDFKELHDTLSVYFESHVDIEVRLQYFAEQLYQLLILAEWDIAILYSVELQGYGTLYQLIFAYVYCINNNIPISNSTTTVASTTAPVTATTPTTAKPNGDCSTVIKVNIWADATTLLLDSINEDQADPSSKWTKKQKKQFSGYKKRIKKFSKNKKLSDESKFKKIKKVLTGFAGPAKLKKKVYAIYIQTWGTIAQYVKCKL